ncbi:hypothetical protein [Streptomyces albidoflavus]|uniref:hypothetical protein n=1 Tax=Streptomyces albidoflavus TaxID=1886 RepID=UPI0013EE82E3|nr:hypothetical protein [Streptomyces albidoflavus]
MPSTAAPNASARPSRIQDYGGKNNEDALGAEDGEEDFGQEGEPHQGHGANNDLSGFMESIKQISAWHNSIDKMLEPARQTIESIMGPGNAVYQAALDAQRQYRAFAEPVLALQSDLSNIYDWHSRINDVVRSVSLPRTLLDQLAATEALFLPANLVGLDTEDLYTILEMGEDEACPSRGHHGPRSSEPCSLSTRAKSVTPSWLNTAMMFSTTSTPASRPSPILSTAIRTARAGFGEGAQALAGNVLETAMKRHGNAWIRRSFPQVTYPPKAGHHGTIGSALDDADDWGDLTLLQFKHYLVLAGMRNAFGPGATQDTFNRHLGAHQASPDTYRAEFVLPAILLAHALLRALNQDLNRPDEA